MLIKNKIVKKSKKIVGRGYGSGKGGHTSGRGTKGQKSRSGVHISPFFEGGQNPLILRLPYLKGFKRQRPEYAVLNLGDIDRLFKENEIVSFEILKKIGILKKEKTVKILGGGELSKKLSFKNDKMSFSKSSLDKIKLAKGEIL
ncbi:MAG: 50S ribosomal protein L15 [Patescibacteria group bacterium]|jgi:large subunit ribosomal protein L15